jgi:hypothetical protein
MSQQNVELVRTIYDAWARGDRDRPRHRGERPRAVLPCTPMRCQGQDAPKPAPGVEVQWRQGYVWTVKDARPCGSSGSTTRTRRWRRRV